MAVFVGGWVVSRVNGPVPLINGIESRQSFGHIKAATGFSSGWEVVESSSLENGSKDVLFAAHSYAFRSIPGQVIFHFFNDELMKTVFIASSYKGRKAELDSFFGADILTYPTESANGEKVLVARDLSGNLCLVWQDKKLLTRQSKFISANR